jgi:hypothetical protein
MVYFITGNGYRLPFETFVVEKFIRNHQHRDRQNFGWTERMELSAHVPALSLAAVVPANNDNEIRNYDAS